MTDGCNSCAFRKNLTTLLSQLRRKGDDVKLTLCFWDLLCIECACSHCDQEKCFKCTLVLKALQEKLHQITALKVVYRPGLDNFFREIGKSSLEAVCALEFEKFPKYFLAKLRKLWPGVRFLTCHWSGLNYLQMASNISPPPSSEPLFVCSESKSLQSTTSNLNVEEGGNCKMPVKKKKNKRLREVRIIDPEENSVFGSFASEPLLLPLDKREVDDTKHLQTKKLVEQKREMLGSGWLVMSSNSPVDSMQDLSRALLDDASPVFGVYVENEEKDDVEIIAEQEEKNSAALLSPSVDVYGIDSLQDEEGGAIEGDLFLVRMAEDGRDLFVSIGQERIVERNVLTGKVQNTLDLRALVSAYRHQEKTEEGMHSVRLVFDTVRKENRERTYRMENEESLQAFLGQMQHAIDERPSVGILQCQKCSAEFSENQVQMVVMSDKATSLYKDGRKMAACPTCHSTVLLQVQQIIRSSALHAINPAAVNLQSEVDGITASGQWKGTGGDEDILGVERSESDITILTNPSQSSIAIVPNREDDFLLKALVLTPFYERDDVVSSSGSTSSVSQLGAEVEQNSITWQQDSVHFVRLDHRIKLYLEMEVFDDNEELLAVIEGGVIAGTDLKEQDGLFVATERHFYALSYRQPKQDDLEVPRGMHLESSVVLERISHIATFPNYQGFCVSSLGGFAILLRHTNLGRDFMKFLKGAMDVKLQHIFSDDLIEETLLSSLPQDSSCPTNHRECLSYFILLPCTDSRRDTEALQPEAVAITREFLYAFSLRYHFIGDFPVRFSVVDAQPISNLTSLHTSVEPGWLGLHYLDDMLGQEKCWILETSELPSILFALKEPWQATFGVELLPKSVCGCVCGV